MSSMKGLEEQSSALAPLAVADLLTHCDQILALRHHACTYCKVHSARKRCKRRMMCLD